MWRDPVLGVAGTELLAGRFAHHRYAPHIRDEVAVAVVTHGAMYHRIGGEEGVALADRVLVIPAGETFSGEAVSDEGWSWRVFYPDVRTLTEMAAEAATVPSAPGDGPLLLDEKALARRLATLHRAIEASDVSPQARQQSFAAAMSAVLQNCARPAGWPRKLHPENKAIRSALERVHARFSDPDLSIRELAAAAAYSPYHFMRSFREAVGVTAHDYVVQCRLHAARAMLAEGVAAAEVAQATGFSDQSHLIRQFRAAHGVTPGQYAEACRQRSGAPPAAAGVRLKRGE